MKTMTCLQLGGACNKEFKANTFDEIAKLSQQHGKEMHQQQDALHLEAMRQMRDLMKDPADFQEWLKFDVTALSPNSATLTIHWENTKLKLFKK